MAEFCRLLEIGGRRLPVFFALVVEAALVQRLRVCRLQGKQRVQIRLARRQFAQFVVRIGAQVVELRPARVDDVGFFAFVRRFGQVKQRLDVAGGGVALARVGGKLFFVAGDGFVQERYCRACLAGKERGDRLFVQLRDFWRQRYARPAQHDFFVAVGVRRVEGLAVGKRSSKRQGK